MPPTLFFCHKSNRAPECHISAVEIARHQGKQYDADGAWAATGKVDAGLLAALFQEPYFALAAPKSTGRDLFHMEWLDAVLARCPALPAADDHGARKAARAPATSGTFSGLNFCPGRKPIFASFWRCVAFA